MRVKWSEFIDIPEHYWDEKIDLIDTEKKYEGEVIGTTSSFWSGTQLTVMCDDGKIREVSIDKAKKA